MESVGMARYHWYKDALPFSALVSMECLTVGLHTLFKAATQQGMSYHVFIVYVYAIAALVLLPSPFISHKSTVLPKLNLRILSKIGLLGLIGSSSQIMGYTGINYSSPTLASAISNLMPALTFILAVLCRMEKVSLKSRSSQAKIIGTIVSMSGAFLVTLYQGPPIIFSRKQSLSLEQSLHSSQPNWTIGGILLTGEYILVTLWNILQAQIMMEYPAELTVVFFYNLCVTFVASIVGLITEPDPSAWRVRDSIGLASVLCSGLFSSCLNSCVHTWALKVKGPFYVAMFKPFSIVIAVALGVIFLGDTLHLGSLIGATIISVGFYTVMWGKVKEEMEDFEANPAGSLPAHEAPLLQNYKADDV